MKNKLHSITKAKARRPSIMGATTAHLPLLDLRISKYPLRSSKGISEWKLFRLQRHMRSLQLPTCTVIRYLLRRLIPRIMILIPVNRTISSHKCLGIVPILQSQIHLLRLARLIINLKSSINNLKSTSGRVVPVQSISSTVAILVTIPGIIRGATPASRPRCQGGLSSMFMFTLMMRIKGIIMNKVSPSTPKDKLTTISTIMVRIKFTTMSTVSLNSTKDKFMISITTVLITTIIIIMSLLLALLHLLKCLGTPHWSLHRKRPLLMMQLISPTALLIGPNAPIHSFTHLPHRTYQNNLFAKSVSSPPAPDRKKVHAVFPWEEKPRHSPRRVFPRTESPPPPANYIESERTSSPVSTPPPPTERRAPPLIQSPTSPTSSPWGLGFSNAWDTVPSIQRYASKLAGSPKIFPHQFMSQPPPEPREGWRKLEKERERDWQEHQDASSMDGDDEGESDEESEHSESSAKSKTSTGSHRKSRALSGKSKKKYCARGVQAVPETKEESIQVNVMVRDGVMHTLREASVATDSHSTTAPCPCCGRSCVPEECASSQASPQQRTGVGLGIRRWPESTGLLPSAVPRDFKAELEQMAGTPIATKNVRSGLPFPGSASPTGLRSPATLGSPRTYSPPKATSPPLAALPPPKIASPRAISPLQAPSPTKAIDTRHTFSSPCSLSAKNLYFFHDRFVQDRLPGYRHWRAYAAVVYSLAQTHAAVLAVLAFLSYAATFNVERVGSDTVSFYDS
ncbi:hypothetical protein EW026_g320 [Hermanssonia centrifuga]|uniref:Uncharacterized protein n=1 Tax=Hermanssonia centrifuga TaxID=98765 RepID=A0A4S4KUX4_9APHY|nr:hypothetical protein EW026_g320 [Hermanssonia centrifuga]